MCFKQSYGGLGLQNLASTSVRHIDKQDMDAVKLVSGPTIPAHENPPLPGINLTELPAISDPEVVWPSTSLFGRFLPSTSAPVSVPSQDHLNSAAVTPETSKTADKGVIECKDPSNNGMASFPSGFLARIAPFLPVWGTTSACALPRTGSPEASLGSSSLSVERSANSVSRFSPSSIESQMVGNVCIRILLIFTLYLYP